MPIAFESVEEVEQALRSAAKAHGKYEAAELGGQFDEDWPAWYAQFIWEAQERTDS